MHHETVCLTGGTGFVGQHLANRLTQHGYKVRILTRRRERHRALNVNPDVTLVETDVHNAEALQQQFSGVDAVINLVGILNESGNNGAGFRQAHIELPEKIVAAATASGVSRLLHMSALNADAGEQHSLYLKTKGAGEDLVHAAADQGLVVTSFRPSVIFGAGDSFFNRFAALLKIAGPVFPLACPDSRFAPVCVTDVVEAMCRSMGDATGGERLDLCGPETFTLAELVGYTSDLLQLRCHVTGLNDTLDNYYSLQHDSVCTDNALPALGITPTPIAAVVPAYLAGQNARGHYPGFRRHSRRNQEHVGLRQS